MIDENYVPTILVVDDLSSNIAILSNLLKKEYKVKIANSGKKALELARSKEKPDLILLDIEMPLMSGYDVCRQLKATAETKEIPVIFVSGKASAEDEEYGLNLGAIDYIKKPFHPAIVKIRVKNHIELKLKSAKLEELSMCDSLTGIPNRRFFEEALEKKHKEMQRDNGTLAVVMIDIDFFKPYNDNYGHWKGDEALTQVARALKRSIKRPTDVAARYGGEEFIVILKNCDQEGAKKVANELVEAVRSLKIEHRFSKASDYVTISAGLAFKEKESSITKEELIKEADEQLYRAKESGRDKYCAAF